MLPALAEAIRIGGSVSLRVCVCGMGFGLVTYLCSEVDFILGPLQLTPAGLAHVSYMHSHMATIG